LLVVVYHS